MEIVRCRNCVHYGKNEKYLCSLYQIKKRPEGFCDCGEASIKENIEHYMPERTGEWIQKYDHYICSICGNQSCCAGDYCPDCGAKMKMKEVILYE